MSSLCNADGSKIMTEDDGYETIVPDLSASEVTQADRDAAADMMEAYRDRLTAVDRSDSSIVAINVRNGLCDDSPRVQAFAHHRQQAIAQHEGGRGEPVAWLTREQTIEAVQSLLERGKATLDSEGYLALVHPPATCPATLVEDEVEQILWHVEQVCGPLNKETCEVEGDDDHSILAHNIRAILSPCIAQQAEEVARLREALKPFARAAGNIPKRFDDSRHVSSEIPLRRDELDEGVTAASLVVSLDGIDVGDYRNARAALNEQPGGEGTR